MANRRESPDILSQLMDVSVKTIEPESNKAIKHELNAGDLPRGGDEEQERNKAIKQENNKEIRRDSGTAIEQAKEKTTFNLSVSTLEKLENTWINLRKKLRDKGRVTKTLIVERAIELAIIDFEKEGEASELYKELIDM